MPCCHCQESTARSRRPGLFKTAFVLLIIYAATVFTGGTLINTGHPIAVELGHILQLVTFVEPLTHWAYGAGIEPVGNVLSFLSGGAPVPDALAFAG